ncbi:MAG: ECF transporter S component [Clostridia bacterium]|nr:ECF transporter S component [Clostridia bacterium]
MQKKSAKLTVISIIALFILAPTTIFLSFKYFDSQSYYIPAVLIIVFSMIPFFVFFENRKIKTSEIVIVALLTALCVGARAVLAFIPQVKPTCAIVIVSAIAFGPNVGFVVGSLSMFVSNFIFGQGAFTPFQMFGMGLVGFICGIMFCGKKYNTNRIAVAITGGLMCMIVYGIIVDTCSVLMMVTEFNLKSVMSIYLSGMPFNLIHGAITTILLFFINKPMTDKFTRLKIKYGIFQME